MNYRIKKKLKKKASKRKKMWYIPEEYPCLVVTTTYHDYKLMHKKNQDYIIKCRHAYDGVDRCSYGDMLRYLRCRTKSVFVPIPGVIL